MNRVRGKYMGSKLFARVDKRLTGPEPFRIRGESAKCEWRLARRR